MGSSVAGRLARVGGNIEIRMNLGNSAVGATLAMWLWTTLSGFKSLPPSQSCKPLHFKSLPRHSSVFYSLAFAATETPMRHGDAPTRSNPGTEISGIRSVRLPG